MGEAVRPADAASWAIFILVVPGASLRKMRLDLKLTLSFSIRGWDVANPNWRKAMKNGKERFVAVSRKNTAGVTLALWMGSGAAMGLAAQGSAIVVRPEGQMATVQS